MPEGPECHIIGNKLHKILGSTTQKNWFDFTSNQISSWGLKFHELIIGKPEADIFIDDKAVNHNSWDWGNNHLTLLSKNSDNYWKQISSNT